MPHLLAHGTFGSMLARSTDEGIVFIGQPAHAWLSGQLARVWGNDKLGRFQPYEEVCLAATQHDIGMTEFDLAPSFDARTGYPHLFTDMPRRVHVDLWNRAARKLIPQSRYAALLVSMHGTGLYEYVDVADEEDDVRRCVESYVSEQERLQQTLLRGLRADPSYSPHTSENALRRNRRLIQIWDLLSLRICMGFDSEVVHAVPAAQGDISLMMVAHEDGVGVGFDPWPFIEDQVTVTVEGRSLAVPSSSEAELHDRLTAAPWKTMRFELRHLRA